MRSVTLGPGGPQVPAVGLGCMGMSEFYAPGDESSALKTLDAAYEMGCRFWDTADIYGPHTNEALLSKALAGRRDDIVVATKFGIERTETGEFSGVNGRPEYVKAACEASLRRLNIDCIDLYYQHRRDPDVPIEETVGAMAQLVQAGKIKHIGLSETDAENLRKAAGEHTIAALQTEYSLWSRDVEGQILPTARELGIGFVAYSPLGRGFLTGTISSRADMEEGDWRLNNPRFEAEAIDHNRKLADQIVAFAARKGVTPAQLSLAWVLAKGDDITTIPGTKRIKYLEENWRAGDLALSAAEVSELDDISAAHATAGERY
ncbi:aldo/keto reductase [Exilibacterium tricleocarpae]|uniref:Aldo/keto reductase n=1 Tax=Exilibacterium tricleocarpae TaxID=2591008 RepID=A0A545T8I0_9GAMM|nr:aldo/keto reductase [Exilibacterium tricleocarpae]TQV73532.1 aldo/keto reductase [Exilibacterium tricleocarpae]